MSIFSNKSIYLFVLFLIFHLSSCKSDDASEIIQPEADLVANQTVVIIKADDLRNLTPNWQLFIASSIKNTIPVSIGIIARDMTIASTIKEVKRISTLKNSNGDLSVEFWNHGYDHSNPKKKKWEFNGFDYSHQVSDIKRSQEFFKNTLGLTCNSFGVPYNQSSELTHEALEEFPEIKVWMCFQKIEKQFHPEWINPNLSNISSTQSKILLDIKCQSIYDVPFQSVKKYLNAKPNIPYLVIQIHPNVWDAKDFLDYQNMIDYLKSKNVIFMTPFQYYNHLINTPSTTFTN